VIENGEFSAFVLMPSGERNEYEGGTDEAEFIYDEIIKPAVEEHVGDGLRCARIDREVDKSAAGSITASLVENLVSADVVVVDLTGSNANVFLELGMRYAVRHSVTVLMAQEGTDIPFDIKGYRFIRYNRFRPREARHRIGGAIGAGLANRDRSDSVVFDVFREMSVLIPGVVDSHGERVAGERDIMSWAEYMMRVEYASELLQHALSQGRISPEAILGISNGGLIAADLIGKRISPASRIPIIALWANRGAHDTTTFPFFNNRFNDAAMKPIDECVNPTSPKGKGATPALIVVDDHMGTGNTALQAIDYLEARLGRGVRIVFIPLVCRRPQWVARVSDYMPFSIKDAKKKPVFDVSSEQFVNFLDTQAAFFPYLKKQINRSTSGD